MCSAAWAYMYDVTQARPVRHKAARVCTAYTRDQLLSLYTPTRPTAAVTARLRSFNLYVHCVSSTCTTSTSSSFLRSPSRRLLSWLSSWSYTSAASHRPTDHPRCWHPNRQQFIAARRHSSDRCRCRDHQSSRLSTLVYLQYIHVHLQYRSTRSTSVLIAFTSQHANPHRSPATYFLK